MEGIYFYTYKGTPLRISSHPSIEVLQAPVEVNCLGDRYLKMETQQDDKLQSTHQAQKPMGKKSLSYSLGCPPSQDADSSSPPGLLHF